MASKFKLFAFVSLLWLASLPAYSQMCNPTLLFPTRPLPATKKITEGWGLQLKANPEILQLKGDAELLNAQLWLRADSLFWNRAAKTLRASGNIRGQTLNWLFKTPRLDYDLKHKTLISSDIVFQDIKGTQRGAAKELKETAQAHVTRLHSAKLTTCPLGQDDWYLHAKRIRVDRKAERVYAHHAWLDFKGVPLFYTPYISYPLSARASGLLMPSFQQYQSPNRKDASWIVGLPYYFNIAPNYDDTLTLYQIQDRGSLLDNEFRSLNTWQRSIFTASWLQDDLTRTARWRVKLSGRQTWTPTLHSDIQWQKTSDRDFYADLPLEPALKTASYAPRHIRLDWTPSADFKAYLLHQDYLLLRNAGIYYEKRPELGATWTKNLNRHYHLSIPWLATNFEIPISGHSRPEGWRTVFSPAVRADWTRAWGQYGFDLKLQNNRYQLRNHARPAPEFYTPMIALHGQLTFERPASEWGNGWIQTLEPKIQFTYIPQTKDQLNAPNFDSGQRTLNFDNLFALNRFTGYDRVGDTQRVSVALTSRLYADGGKERARFALGQAFYLSSRKIALNGLQNDTTPRSNYFAQLRLNNNWLLLDNTAEIDQHSLALTNLSSRLKLQLKQLQWRNQYLWEHINTSNENQRLLSGLQLQFRHNWHAGTFWHYDFTHNRRIETLTALGYESCCWKTEIQLSETQLLDGRYNYSVRLTLTLKGLSTVGRTFSQQLKDKLNF